MRVLSQGRLCYATGCDAQAEFSCAGCDKPLCRRHVQLIRLERRIDPSENMRDLLGLARLPIQIKTYAFCLRCR